MRYLIRIAKSRFDDWVNGAGDARVLAESIFRPTKARRREFKDLYEDSTYLVEGEIEELQAAAAHLLADQEPKMETRYLVRILLSDVQETGFQVDDSAIGTTGVTWVDFRHRDLVGTKDQFQRLVAVLLRFVREGQDRVRRIGAAQYEFALGQFALLPATERPTRTLEVINCLLNKTRVADLHSDVTLAKAECSNITIPQETLALRAFCFERDGMGAGSMKGTWEKAESELRREYARHYLHEHLGQ